MDLCVQPAETQLADKPNKTFNSPSKKTTQQNNKQRTFRQMYEQMGIEG